MIGRTDISENELHAYIDGALDADRHHAVEAALVADPLLVELVAGFQSDREMLKRVYGPLIDRPTPREWLDMARAPLAPARRSVSWRQIASLAATVLVVLGVAMYWELPPRQPTEIVQAALQARLQPADADRVIATQPGASYDSVLSAAVSSPVHVPDLTKLGYRLAAIRLYSHGANGGAAELAYRDGSDRLFTMYVSRSNGAVRFDQFRRDGLRVCVWQDEVLSAVMAGDVSTAAMQRLASLAYSGLTA